MIKQNLATGNNLTHFICRFSVSKDSNKYAALFYLLIDGKPYYFNNLETAEKQFQTVTGTVTINLKLDKGQVVSVQNFYSDAVYGWDDRGFMYSFFSGYMMAAL